MWPWRNVIELASEKGEGIQSWSCNGLQASRSSALDVDSMGFRLQKDYLNKSTV